jgi:hypothetical protein
VPAVPGCSEEEAIASGDPVDAIDNIANLVWIGELLSLTVTVKFDVPVAVGVPEITPVDGERVKPAGRAPELIDQL